MKITQPLLSVHPCAEEGCKGRETRYGCGWVGLWQDRFMVPINGYYVHAATLEIVQVDVVAIVAIDLTRKGKAQVRSLKVRRRCSRTLRKPISLYSNPARSSSSL